jgi:hypothetical protein
MLLAMALIVATPLVYISVLFVFDQAARVGGPEPFLLASVVTGSLFVLCWVRLWYREVSWSSRRWLWTALAVAGAAVPAMVVYGAVLAVQQYADELAGVLAFWCWGVVWIGCTAIIWRETDAERIERLKSLRGRVLSCPKCGYNMTGLYEARCPECGTQFTLDGLFTAETDRRGSLEDE